MLRRIVRASSAVLAMVVVGTCCVGCSKSAPPAPNATEVQEFQNALNDGDAVIVDRLLSAKPGLVNVRDGQGRTPLAQARARDDSEMVEVIERHGGSD